MFPRSLQFPPYNPAMTPFSGTTGGYFLLFLSSESIPVRSRLENEEEARKILVARDDRERS